jgi:hypothetical protein
LTGQRQGHFGTWLPVGVGRHLVQVVQGTPVAVSAFQTHSGFARVMAWNCSLVNGGIKTSRTGHAAGGPRSAPQMSAIPIQPVPSVTGTCRNPGSP